MTTSRPFVIAILVVVSFFACRAAAQTCSDFAWRPADPAPPARLGASLVFDSARHRAVLFGGHYWAGSQHLLANDTWDWNGQLQLWSRRFSQTSPQARDSHAAAFDPVRNTILLFGGSTLSFPNLGDTWEFDGMSGQWRQLAPAVSPSPRQGAAMFFDPISQRILLFGGLGPSSVIGNELWEWNPDQVTWTPRQQLNPPPPRSFTTIVPESTQGRFLLFGGYLPATSPATSDQTWRFDSATSSWTQLQPANRPERRAEHVLIPDPTRQRLVLFGGQTYSSQSFLSDTWEWDEATQDWLERLPSSAPAGRSYAAAAYDGSRQRPILFGGYRSTTGTFGDQWEWHSVKGEWIEAPHPRPTPSNSQTMAYDAARQRIVLLSGASSPATMWEWDGQFWFDKGPADPVPVSAPLAFDGTRIIATFSAGGPVLQTWGWDGAAWSRLADCPTPPGGTGRLAFDSFRGRTVLFMGDSRQTWEWDGLAWEHRATGGPPVLPTFAMTFDTVRRQTVLHGNGTTFVWNGTQWTFVAQLGAADFDIAFDRRRGVVVLIGGGGTFEWNGSGPWTEVPLQHRLIRRWAKLAFHDAAGHLLLFGGSTVGNVTFDSNDRLTLVRGCTCYANCDGSTGTPALTANDFICFMNRFAANDPYANCDGSSGNPLLTANDFQCFLIKFVDGCP